MSHPAPYPGTPTPPPGPSRSVEVFQFPATGHTIRAFVDDEPVWVAADLCAALAHSNPTMAVAGLDEDEKGLRIVETPSGRQQMVVVNEPGLYSLILRSRKPEAKAFKRWITHDVLPAVRRTGRYEVAPALPQTYSEALRELAAQVEETERTRAQLAIAAPKADYVDSFVNPTEDTSTIRVFAGQLGVGEKTLREWLVAQKLIYRRAVDQRWSHKSQRLETEYEWLAYSTCRSWFTPIDQPQAPRMHNGQVRTTLYVTPVGKVQIRRLLMKHPLDDAEAKPA